jgi:hypothetical protein
MMNSSINTKWGGRPGSVIHIYNPSCSERQRSGAMQFKNSPGQIVPKALTGNYLARGLSGKAPEFKSPSTTGKNK